MAGDQDQDRPRAGGGSVMGAARRNDSADPLDAALTRDITTWFKSAERDLPWRRGRSGYKALVSELMLQQTQVSRVVDSFVAFLERFPTIEALAAAPEHDVLAAWRGLGYYRRARLLHAAAKAIIERHGGEVPRQVEALQALPGIGRYTAGSIASIVFGARAPIVDGNVARVLLRIHGREVAPDLPATVAWLWRRADELVRASRSPGRFNEGVMELGALVCTPRAPDCANCPVQRHCRAYAEGTVDRIPTPKQAAIRRTVHHHVVLVRRGGLLLMEQRPARGLWAGMWQAPTVESDEPLSPAILAASLTARTGCSITSPSAIDSFIHMTSHREVRFVIHEARTRSRRGHWLTPMQASALPMSSAMRGVVEGRGRDEG